MKYFFKTNKDLIKVRFENKVDPKKFFITKVMTSISSVIDANYRRYIFDDESYPQGKVYIFDRPSGGMDTRKF